MGTGATEQGLRGTPNPTRVADIKRLLAFILSLVVSEWTEDSAEGCEEGISFSGLNVDTSLSLSTICFYIYSGLIYPNNHVYRASVEQYSRRIAK